MSTESQHDIDLSIKDEITEIAHLAMAGGTKVIPEDPLNPTAQQAKRFRAAAHDGWKQAQVRMIELVTKIESDRKRAREKIKELNRSRDRDSAKLLSRILDRMTHVEHIVRSIANAIAWTMMRDERWRVRRLYMGHPQTELSSSDINPVIQASEEINRSDQSFALISDLSSLVQVGDLLVAGLEDGNSSISIVEVKTGEHSKRTLEFLDKLPLSPYDPEAKEFFESSSASELKESERIVRQLQRSTQVRHLWNHDEGTDPRLGMEIKLVGPAIEVGDWDSSIDQLCNEALASGRAVGVVDECMWVGAYDCKQTKVTFHGTNVPPNSQSTVKYF